MFCALICKTRVVCREGDGRLAGDTVETTALIFNVATEILCFHNSNETLNLLPYGYANCIPSGYAFIHFPELLRTAVVLFDISKRELDIHCKS
jgi:hypothetical protein